MKQRNKEKKKKKVGRTKEINRERWWTIENQTNQHIKKKFQVQDQ
jgi:hypothetical protein